MKSGVGTAVFKQAILMGLITCFPEHAHANLQCTDASG